MVNPLAPYSMLDLLGMLDSFPNDARVLAEIESRKAAHAEAERRSYLSMSPAMRAACDRIRTEIPPLAAKLEREATDRELNSLKTQFCRLPFPHPDRDKLIRKMQARKDALAAAASVDAIASERAA